MVESSLSLDSKIAEEQAEIKRQAIKIEMLCDEWFPVGRVMQHLDAEGFVTCPIHKVRRKGWSGVPKLQYLMAKHPSNPKAQLEFAEKPAHSFGMNYYAVEQFVLFGVQPAWMKRSVELGQIRL